MVPPSQFIDIPDPDQPIYRVFSNRRFFQMISDRKLTLVIPRKWEDPFENFLYRARAQLKSGQIVGLSGIFKNFYGQCWTTQRDSDAMWRIYSSDQKSIRVRSTPRKLIAAIYDARNPFATMSYFAGKVQYLTEAEIRHYFQDGDFTKSVVLDNTGRGQVAPLLIKRSEFAHESEVRLLFRYNKDGDSDESPEEIWDFAFDPFATFDEPTLDPRLTDTEAADLAQKVAACGFPRPIDRSPLYRIPHLAVRLNV